jgi:hypothetical protein
LSRAFDLIAVAAVAVVLLLPKASLKAKPALVGEKVELDRIAALEDALYAEPESVDAAVALSDAYLRLLHPDWVLSTLDRFSSKGDHRVHLMRATAHAERLEAEACMAETQRGLAACDAAGPAKCPEAIRTKFSVISSAMKALVDQDIDPHKNPQKAREAVSGVLHATKASSQKPAPAPAPKK